MTFIPKFIHHIFDKAYIFYIINKSGLFDESWYLQQYPNVKKYKKSALSHYLKIGYKLGYDPSYSFSTQKYEEAYNPIIPPNTNPLVHYLTKGKKKGLEIFQHIDIHKLEQIWLEENNPLVSIIVPNYNHAVFLEQRLECIYSQDYKNFEVILMDDASTDNSVSILKEYATKYASQTTLLLNATNTGSPFAQWKKGIQAAKGEFIWIAESDDWCDVNFLSTLLPSFRDESVKLTFTRSVFMKNNQAVWTIEDYLHDISGELFTNSFVMSSHRCVKHYFSKRNIIPNVSSCIFHKPSNLQLFDNLQWRSMKVCGDWIFYLDIISGGSISYSTRTTNYYRQHASNTSVGLHQKDCYYQEHQLVREYLAEHYALSTDELNWIVDDKRRFWKENRNDYTEISFNNLFPSENITDLQKKRLPNVAICSFAFTTGGGEKVPIDQANALHEAGLSVTFIDFAGQQRNDKIRKKLDRDIPLITLKQNKNTITEIFEEYGIEIIHSHHASVDFCIAENNHQHIKHIVTLHGMYETIQPKYIKDQMPILKQEVSKWLYIADKNTVILRKYGITDKSLLKIFNAVPCTSPQKTNIEVRNECGANANSTILTIASRALPEKGWVVALNCIARIRENTSKDLRLILIGDGPVYEQFKGQTIPWAFFTGYSDDVISYFNAADIVLLPTTYSGESFPLCILEALQAGKPVIATDIGEIKTMLTNGNKTAGRVIQIKENKINDKDIDNAIYSLIGDKAEYDKAVETAREINERYSMKNLTKLLIEQYQEVLRDKECFQQ